MGRGVGAGSILLAEAIAHEMGKMQRPTGPDPIMASIIGFAMAFMISLALFSRSAAQQEAAFKANYQK